MTIKRERLLARDIDCKEETHVMARCDCCGNDYDKTFEVSYEGKKHIFDSFECAIHMLAPECPQCRCKVIGHGVEAEGEIFCCVHCAERAGVKDLKDRA
jgi:hypothetical protein